MPNTVTHPLMAASDVREGDRLARGDSWHLVVDSPIVKTKFTYIPLEGRESPLRVDSTLCFTVKRDEETPEERTAREATERAEHERRMAEYVEHHCEDAAEYAVQDLEKSRQKMLDAVAKEGNSTDIHWRMGGEFTSLIRAEMTVGLWMQVRGVKGRTLPDGRVLDTWAKATAEVRDHMMHQLYRSTDFNRGSSRSTSMMHNIIDDIRREALCDWVRDLEWKLPVARV